MIGITINIVILLTMTIIINISKTHNISELETKLSDLIIENSNLKTKINNQKNKINELHETIIMNIRDKY